MPCKDCETESKAAQDNQPSMQPAAPYPNQGKGGPHGGRTRDFPTTWDTAPSVPGPMGRMNVGYNHNVVSTEGQWARGELPAMGYGYTFALRRPHLMREPFTNLGSYSFAQG
jgi:hypothetical protein